MPTLVGDKKTGRPRNATRAEVIGFIEHAGMTGDQARMMRLYTENRISFKVAMAAFRKGAAAARAFGSRS